MHKGVNDMKAVLSASILSAAIFMVVFSTNLFAQPADTNVPRNLSDYLRLAEQNNAGLKAGKDAWTAAKEEIPQAKSLPDPVVSYGYATRPTPQRSEFEAMQMFPWFGTIDARSDQAKAMTKSASRQYNAQKLEVFFQVKQAFYEYAYLAREIEITKENLELVRHLEEITRIKYATSTSTNPDVIRAQIELSELENEVVSMERQRPALVAKLNSILNRSSESELPWPDEPNYEKVSIDRQKLTESVRLNNPQLQALDYQVEAAQSGRKLAEKKFYPEIGLGVGVSAGMGENMGDRTMLKMQLSIPLWRSNYKAAERQAQAQLSQIKQQKTQMANDLTAKAQEVLYEYENNQRKIELYRDVVIPRALEMLTTSQTAYQAGTIDFLNLIDAQRKLLEYQLMYEQARADYAKRLAELEMLAGEELYKP
jgi:outer membrane protein, heavy metal efflux system